MFPTRFSLLIIVFNLLFIVPNSLQNELNQPILKMLKKRSALEDDSENSLTGKVTDSVRKSVINTVPNTVAAPRTIKPTKYFNTPHIYCFYGTDHNEQYSKAVSHLDYQTGSWEKPKNLSPAVPRAYVAGATIGSKIYLFGGMAHGNDRRNTTEVFDASTDTLNLLEPMPEGRNAPAAAVLNGSIYITGGWAPNDDIHKDVLRYNVGTNQWEKLSQQMHEQRAAHSLVELGGRLYAIGGANQKTAEMYDPTTGSWSVIAEPNYQHSWFRAVAHAGKIYALSSKGFESYTPGNNLEAGSWAVLSSLNKLYGTALVSVDGKLLAIGGATEYKGVKEVHSYDVKEDTWTKEANMKDGRAYQYCGVIKN